MIALPAMPIFFTGGYITYVFLACFGFGILNKLFRG